MLCRVAVNDTVLVDQIKELTNLSQLNLLGCHQISDHGLKQLLQAVPGLTFLDISSCRCAVFSCLAVHLYIAQFTRVTALSKLAGHVPVLARQRTQTLFGMIN